jgi:hypothetical protein
MTDEDLALQVADLGDVIDELRDKMTEARRELFALACELENANWPVPEVNEWERKVATRVRNIFSALDPAQPPPTPTPPAE